MFKRWLVFLLAFPACIFAYIDEPYHDTAFVGPPHTFYGLTYFSYYKTNYFWNQHGKKLPTFNQFHRKTYRVDMEYDINCNHAIFLKGGYSMVNEQLNGNSRGLEDPEASWQYLFYRDCSSAFSGRLTAVIPVGPKKSCIRYGKFGAEIRLLHSRIFKLLHRCWWCDLGLGYRFYIGFPSDQIRASGTLGCALTSYAWILSSTQLFYGIFNGKSEANRNNICFHSNFRLLTTQVQGIIQIYKYISLNAGGYFHLWGENVGAGGGFYGGIWFIF